eukprot:GHVS01108869.1.p1 GENE.GHVS01108869.1~~GHVS01108869.1.p1  ORF type:complete len:421 (+),score=41.92 GHVS01108869.1:724-1986(+)
MKFGSPYCMEMTSTVRRSFDRKLCAIALSIMLISAHVGPANSSVVHRRVLQPNNDSTSSDLIPRSPIWQAMSTFVLLPVMMGWIVGQTVGSPIEVRPTADTTTTEPPTGLLKIKVILIVVVTTAVVVFLIFAIRKLTLIGLGNRLDKLAEATNSADEEGAKSAKSSSNRPLLQCKQPEETHRGTSGHSTDQPVAVAATPNADDPSSSPQPSTTTTPDEYSTVSGQHEGGSLPKHCSVLEGRSSKKNMGESTGQPADPRTVVGEGDLGPSIIRKCKARCNVSCKKVRTTDSNTNRPKPLASGTLASELNRVASVLNTLKSQSKPVAAVPPKQSSLKVAADKLILPDGGCGFFRPVQPSMLTQLIFPVARGGQIYSNSQFGVGFESGGTQGAPHSRTSFTSPSSLAHSLFGAAVGGGKGGDN